MSPSAVLTRFRQRYVMYHRPCTIVPLTLPLGTLSSDWHWSMAIRPPWMIRYNRSSRHQDHRDSHSLYRRTSIRAHRARYEAYSISRCGDASGPSAMNAGQESRGRRRRELYISSGPHRFKKIRGMIQETVDRLQAKRALALLALPASMLYARRRRLLGRWLFLLTSVHERGQSIQIFRQCCAIPCNDHSPSTKITALKGALERPDACLSLLKVL